MTRSIEFSSCLPFGLWFSLYHDHMSHMFHICFFLTFEKKHMTDLDLELDFKIMSSHVSKSYVSHLSYIFLYLSFAETNDR